MARSNAPVHIQVDNLNYLLRALTQFGKDMDAELKKTSQQIADHVMVPALRSEASSVPHWGERLSAAGAITSKKDRIPTVNIGFARVKFSGGADSRMMRYPTHSGQGRQSPAPFTATNWITRAAAKYRANAMDAWILTIERHIEKWNRTK